MQSDCKNYFGFLVEEFSGIHLALCNLTAGHFTGLPETVTVTTWSRKNFENVVFRYVQAQRMFPLQMQNNDYNHIAFLNKHQILSTRFNVAFCGNSVNKFDCRAFGLFKTVTRGSHIKTLAILWYAQAWSIRPLQIHDNFLESLGYSKQTWHLLIRFKRSFLSQCDKYLLLPM